MRCVARRRPWAGVVWWKMSRTCWAQWSATSTLIVYLICREGLTESFLLTLREPITPGAQDKPDVVEGITCAPAVTDRVVLDAAASLTWGVASEHDDVEGAARAGCVLGAGQAMVFLLSLEGDRASASRSPAHKSCPRSAPRSCTRCQTCPAPGPICGPWDVPSREWSRDAGELVGPGGVGRGGVTRLSSTLGIRTPAKRAGSSDAACRHGLIGHHTVFHVVPHWRASPRRVAPSKRNCRIAQRIARAPRRARGAHTFSLCSRNVTVWQVRARHIQRGIVPPEPCREPGPRARRSPPPPHARGREQVAPQPGQPAQRSQDSLSSARPYSRRAAATRWKPSTSTSRSHRSQRPSDTEQQVG